MIWAHMVTADKQKLVQSLLSWKIRSKNSKKRFTEISSSEGSSTLGRFSRCVKIATRKNWRYIYLRWFFWNDWHCHCFRYGWLHCYVVWLHNNCGCRFDGKQWPKEEWSLVSAWHFCETLCLKFLFPTIELSIISELSLFS